MRILKQISISTWVMFTLLSWSAHSLSAQPSGPNPASSAAPFSPKLFLDGQSVWSRTSTSLDFSLEGIKNASLYPTKSRVNNLSIGISQSQVFMRNGRASFTLYAPTPTVNRSLFLANSASDSQIDVVWVSVIQALSLVANRQVNTEFTYSMPVSKNSKLDSAINYRLSPITNSGYPGIAASFQYYGKF